MITRRQSVSLLGASVLSLSAIRRLLAADAPKAAATLEPLFGQPFIDIDEWRDKPVRHRYVHGGFKGTDALFSIYLPPKEQYHGRFFQPIGAVSGNENSAQQPSPLAPSSVTQENSTIGFAVASGAYLVESNLGKKDMFASDDHTIVGYRTSAAVAQYSRLLAAEMYGPHRTYGYAYGGSGGGYKTISGAESTTGVWDGVVPYVIGSPMHVPYVFMVQAHALRILKEKIPDIIDAVDPGGSGDMYAGLSDEERAALLEVSRMGLPPRVWFAHNRLGYGPLATLIDDVVKWDPSYFDDFWKLDGYLGANPPESLRAARIQQQTTLTRVIMSDEAKKLGLPVPMAAWAGAPVPAALELQTLPKGELLGASLIFKSGAAAGQRFSASGVKNGLVMLGIGQSAFKSIDAIKAGDQILIDNSIYLAAQTYHRHQVPSRDFYVWDQFRGPDGKPLYPQRPVLLGPKYAEQGAGSVQSGRFGGKMIVVESLVDEYAYPWAADWYRSKVKEAIGARLDDHFRLWFVDQATHGSVAFGQERTRISGYLGVLQQALRDLSAWVEKGIAPPPSTVYKVTDGQIQVPAKASERKSIQPTIALTANGAALAKVSVGQTVSFAAVVEAPPNTGSIVSAEWDFEGSGDFPVAQPLKDTHSPRVTVSTTYTFRKPGTYFPALRAASQRTPDGTRYAQVQNLARVRIVVG